jgi:protein-disulfide isomerase
VDANVEQARQLGVRSTPTSFVNGRAVVGNQPPEAFTAMIDDELTMRGAAP